MAKKLKEFKFTHHGQRNKYPWDEWLDGGIWELKRGEDFECRVVTLYNSAIKYANRAGKKLRSSRVGEDVIVIQMYDPKEGMK